MALGAKRRSLLSVRSADLTDEQSEYVTGFMAHLEAQIGAVLDALLELDPAQN